ncbi:BTAD domain-containing putative transcriptional regulator [Thermoflexus sp.]|uniref:ATP-binding protein n=1 Tax=Thermoflexus sp. TaxID=1969742 RepID=UPI0035E41D3A
MYRGKVLLLGTVQILSAQGEPLEAPSPRLQALCVYLALHQGEPLDRRRLAFQIWPNVSEPAARRNLRQYLHRLRLHLRPLDPEGTLIVADGGIIVFDAERSLWVDVLAFREQLQRAAASDGAVRLAALRRAVDLYQGDLAPSVYDEWCNTERERLRQQYERALEQLVAAYEADRRWDEVAYWAERALQVNPLQESMYHKLMLAYAQLGDRAQALAVYERCRNTLQDALGVEPLPETQRLYQALRRGEPAPPREARPVGAVEEERRPASEPSEPPAGSNVVPASSRRWVVPPLIGREEDLRWLHAAVAEAQPRGVLLLIEGEAGIGKTRLVSEWVSQLRPAFRVLRVEAGEFGHIIPYHTLKALLEEHAATLPWDTLAYKDRWAWAVAHLLPPWDQAPVPLSGTTAVTTDHWMLMEGLGWLFQALVEEGPVLLWVDDAHWADHPTWQTLAYLAQRLTPHLPLYVVLSFRPEELSEPLRQIRRRLLRSGLARARSLSRLGRKDTFALARSVLGPHVDPDVLERLYTLTEGNPLFVIEMARTIMTQPARRWFYYVPKPHEIPLPQRVRAIVESRVDTLSPPARELLQVAAVVGRTFSVATVQQLAEVEEPVLLNALDEWLHRGLVEETENGYAFSHTLIWQGIYHQLSTARRQWLHRRLAEMLEQSGQAPAALVAQHYAASDRAHKALPFFMAAADEALRARSYEEAKACALEVLRIWQQTPYESVERDIARVDVNLQLAHAYTLSGLVDEAVAILEETRELAERLGDPARLARVFFRLAQAFWHQGNPRAAQDQARSALHWAELAQEARVHAAALRMLGRTGIVLSAFDDAIMALRRHLDEVPSDDPSQVSVWSYLAVAWARVGHWSQAFAAAERAVALAEQQPSPMNQALAYLHHGFVWLERLQWGQAERLSRQALERVASEPFTPVYFMAKAVHAYAQGMLGRGTEAINALQEVLQRAAEERYRVLIHLPYYFLAHVYFHHAAYTDALATVRRAMELAGQAGDRWAMAVALRLEAEILSALPHPDWRGIEERLVRSVDILRQVRARPDLARAYLSLRRLYDRAARMAWAVDCHFRAISLFEEMGMLEELRAAQGQARRPPRPAPSALTAPLAGPSWLRGQRAETEASEHKSR